MEETEGRITDIVYRNEDNRNSVFDIISGGERITCIGKAPEISVGMPVKVTGRYIIPAQGRKRMLVQKTESISSR